MLVDYHIHPLGHGEYRHTEESVARFAAAARAAGLAEIGFADHDCYSDLFDFQSVAAVRERFPDVQIRFGMEVEYCPGQEAVTGAFLSGYELDYVIGSVHFLDGWAFDHPDYTDRYAAWDTAALYRKYYQILSLAAGAGLFDIIGHLDLIKIFGYRPPDRADEYAAAALAAVARSGLCVEINTNGAYKPVGEFYPSAVILERCFALNIPVTLSSDAHAPESVGRDIRLAAAAARRAGYRQIATFAGRRRRMAAL